ncbi:MXAN_2561 family MXYO-CTERM-anchored protein [Hyalangium versicolor]|uniref:MXAN_2561 family MXYO-CTERM-anchored protein n=1 Tax=Hyalangium versicolor TaxID=2861190 RepID=UPI001CCD4DBC|nr:MXAN_2561 family MXYO-CTERM-anchored protein [Hyalangium versicolor]
MRFLLIALTLTATAAWSQTAIDLTLPNTADTELRLSKDCDLVRTVNWTNNIAVLPCDDLKFWIVEGSCGDEPPSGTTLLDSVSKSNVPTTRSGTLQFKVRDLPLFKNGESCPVDGKEVEYQLCASVPTTGSLGECSSNGRSYQKDDVDIIYDALAPDVPSIGNVAPLDEALSIRVNVADDANRIRLHVERADGTGGRNLEQSSEQNLFRVTNLENGVTYRITAKAVDAADNESGDSEAKEGIPIHTKGFFDRYVEAEGQEMGGCGAAAGGVAGGWVLAVLGFWLSSRRNRS